MSTDKMLLREAGSEDDIARKFLQVSAAYMLGCAYCASLRAAFARSPARDPVSEHALRYCELILHEVSALMRIRLEEATATFAAAAQPVSVSDVLGSRNP
jgi:hypothetical protein